MGDRQIEKGGGGTGSKIGDREREKLRAARELRNREKERSEEQTEMRIRE